MQFNKKTLGFLFIGIACVIWIITNKIIKIKIDGGI